MEDIRVSSYQETFNDVAVREIAKTRASCLCKLQFKRCAFEDCQHCDVGFQYSKCYALMNDYDRLRLGSYVSEEYLSLSRYPDAWRSHKSFVMHYVITAIVVILLLIIICIPTLFVGPFDRPPSSSLSRKIVDNIVMTQKVIWDCDKDGVINCCDHAIIFKLFWDIKYPALASRCEIVRNYNPGKLNHLFVSIFDDSGRRIMVEPYTQNINEWIIQDVWGDRYDPAYNRYGETQKWLSTIK